MLDTEVYELLAAAKPLLDDLIVKRFRLPPSRIERNVFQKLETILQNHGYSEQLLEKAGWSYKHLAFLQGRLVFYAYCEEHGVPIPQ